MTPKKILFFICAVLITASFILPSLSAAQSPPPNSYGSFDIAKVRQAMGDTTIASMPAAISKPVSLFVVLMRIGLSMAVLFVILIGLVWFLKKAGFNSSSKIGGGASMDVVEVLTLGQNRTIVLVRLMDKILVVAQTPSHTALLDTIEGPRAIEIIAGKSEGPSMAQFKDVFNTFIDKLKKQEPQRIA